MNARDQKIAMHGLRMRSNYEHKNVLDLNEREKLIRKDLESVGKIEGNTGPDTPRSG